MKHQIQDSLKEICQMIVSENKTLEEWCEIESDDMFQSGNYMGGFDATEEEFCFSVFIDDAEYWFQFPIKDAELIANSSLEFIEIYKADK